MTGPESSLLSVDGIERRDGAPAPFVLHFVRRGVEVLDGAEVQLTEPSPRLEGGLILRRSTSTYLRCNSGLPDLVEVGADSVVVDGAVVAVKNNRLALQGLPLLDGDHCALLNSGGAVRFRLLDRLTGPDERGEVASNWDDVPAALRVAVPHARMGEDVWVIGGDGSLAERRPPTSRWVADLGLPSTEVDVTGLLRSLPFAPRFVVSRDARLRTWVTKVPRELSVADPDADPARYDSTRARALVSSLLVDAQPASISIDRDWRRTLAILMRKVQR